MCGIAGLIGVSGNMRHYAEKLLTALRHRGPDDEGFATPAPSVLLVHTRLAIIDVSPAGHQPMRDVPPVEVAPNWTAYNGEIFNFQELNALLYNYSWAGRASIPAPPQALAARTRSDTETLLHAYRVWGAECVNRLRGMFAFALYDATAQTVLLARDRLGIKPLYYARVPSGGFAFASEVRALLGLGKLIGPRQLRRGALESFLAQGAVQGAESFFANIELLSPGQTLTLDAATGRELRRKTYWQLPLAAEMATSVRARADAVDEIRAVAREAVRLRLISDVPTGLFLSGGIDSAALLAWATENNAAEIRTLSLGFDVAEADESREAAATAAALGSQHTTQILTGKQLCAAWPRALAAMEQPTVDGLNTYIVSQAARAAGLTVALSGLGGDELFGGYASFTDVPRALRVRQSFWLRNLAKIGGRLRGGRGGVKLVEAARREPDALNFYLLRRELFLPHERRALHNLPDGSDAVTGLPIALIDDVRRRGAAFDELNRISFFELELYTRNMLLRDGDAFSMAAPIEYRVPLLDHKLVELLMRVPGAWKRPDPRLKPLLIDAVGPRLPCEVWQRPKRGFAFPWAAWFAKGGAFHATACEAVADDHAWRGLGLNANGVRDIWRRFAAGDKSVHALQILAFVTLRDYATRYGLAV